MPAPDVDPLEAGRAWALKTETLLQHALGRSVQVQVDEKRAALGGCLRIPFESLEDARALAKQLFGTSAFVGALTTAGEKSSGRVALLVAKAMADPPALSAEQLADEAARLAPAELRRLVESLVAIAQALRERAQEVDDPHRLPFTSTRDRVLDMDSVLPADHRSDTAAAPRASRLEGLAASVIIGDELATAASFVDTYEALVLEHAGALARARGRREALETERDDLVAQQAALARASADLRRQAETKIEGARPRLRQLEQRYAEHSHELRQTEIKAAALAAANQQLRAQLHAGAARVHASVPVTGESAVAKARSMEASTRRVEDAIAGAVVERTQAERRVEQARAEHIKLMNNRIRAALRRRARAQ